MQDENEITCGACGGPVIILGQLGNTTHFKCRNCGAQGHEAPLVDPSVLEEMVAAAREEQEA